MLPSAVPRDLAAVEKKVEKTVYCEACGSVGMKVSKSVVGKVFQRAVAKA